MHTKIKGFPNYDIYQDGLVVNRVSKKPKSKIIIRNYYYVDLNYKNKRKNCRLGRLVAKHFIPNPKKLPQINHVDGNRLNDNVSNLEWVTSSENLYHRIALNKKNGTYKSPQGNMKFKRQTIEKLWNLRAKGLTHSEIAKKLKMGNSTVTHILLGTRRKNQ